MRWTHEACALLSVLSVFVLLLVTLERGLRAVFCAFLGFLRALVASTGSADPKTKGPLVGPLAFLGLFSLSITVGGNSSTSIGASSGRIVNASGGLSGRSSGGLGECPEGALLGVTSSWETGNMHVTRKPTRRVYCPALWGCVFRYLTTQNSFQLRC